MTELIYWQVEWTPVQNSSDDLMTIFSLVALLDIPKWPAILMQATAMLILSPEGWLLRFINLNTRACNSGCFITCIWVHSGIESLDLEMMDFFSSQVNPLNQESFHSRHSEQACNCCIEICVILGVFITGLKVD